MIQLYNKHKILFRIITCMIALSFIIPILLEILIFENNVYSPVTNDAWASFWGSFAGGIIGGCATLIALYITVENNIKVQTEANNLARDIQDEANNLTKKIQDEANKHNKKMFLRSIINEIIEIKSSILSYALQINSYIQHPGMCQERLYPDNISLIDNIMLISDKLSIFDLCPNNFIEEQKDNLLKAIGGIEKIENLFKWMKAISELNKTIDEEQLVYDEEKNEYITIPIGTPLVLDCQEQIDELNQKIADNPITEFDFSDGSFQIYLKFVEILNPLNNILADLQKDNID